MNENEEENSNLTIDWVHLQPPAYILILHVINELAHSLLIFKFQLEHTYSVSGYSVRGKFSHLLEKLNALRCILSTTFRFFRSCTSCFPLKNLPVRSIYSLKSHSCGCLLMHLGTPHQLLHLFVGCTHRLHPRKCNSGELV